jgi:hypothetical protein
MQAVCGDKCVDVSTIRWWVWQFNPLNAELNPICHLLALLGGATIVDVSRLRVKQEEMGEASFFDKARLGRPVTATDKPHEERFEDTV